MSRVTKLQELTSEQLEAATPDDLRRSYRALVDHHIEETTVLAQRVTRLRAAIGSVIDDVEGAAHNFESRGKGGQQVSYCGPFAAIGPSAVGQFRRMARDLRSALSYGWPMLRHEFEAMWPNTDKAELDRMFQDPAYKDPP